MKAVHLFEQAQTLPPNEQARHISSRLQETLAGSSISLWQPQEAVPSVGRRTLLGIAPYSLPDLQLVDAIKENLWRGSHCEDQVEVFDVMSCTTMEDFENRIPGIGKVYQTPVVGIWKDGVLVEKASGARARQLLLEYYGLG